MNARSIRTHSSPAARDSILGIYARAILPGGAAAGVLLLIGSAVCCMQTDPMSVIAPAALLALYLPAAVFGFCIGRASEKVLLHGAAAGGLYCLLITALALIFAGDAENYPIGISIALHIAIIAASVSGAWLGRRRAARASHTRKKRRR